MYLRIIHFMWKGTGCHLAGIGGLPVSWAGLACDCRWPRSRQARQRTSGGGTAMPREQLRLRSRSPASGEGARLLGKINTDDVESGSGSEGEGDPPLNPLLLQQRIPPIAAGILRGMLVGCLAIGWMMIFHDKICGVVSNCGCTWPWAGGWRKCNTHNHDGPRCPWCVASSASKLLDVVSQKSAPLSIVATHLLQECAHPFRPPTSEQQHWRTLLSIGIGSCCVFALHLPAHGLFLSLFPLLFAAALAAAPCGWSSSNEIEPQEQSGRTSIFWTCGLPVVVYITVEL